MVRDAAQARNKKDPTKDGLRGLDKKKVLSRQGRHTDGFLHSVRLQDYEVHLAARPPDRPRATAKVITYIESEVNFAFLPLHQPRSRYQSRAGPGRGWEPQKARERERGK